MVTLVENSTISRRDFLKLICAGGVAIALTPLIRFENAIGVNISKAKTNEIVTGQKILGPDGVAFLYPSKVGG